MLNINVLILKALQGKSLYGLEIIKSISEQSNGKINIKQPSLYSALRRFEVKGYVSSYWEDSDIGGKRHYYTLTKSGQDFLNRVLNSQPSFNNSKINKNESTVINNENNEDEFLGESFSANFIENKNSYASKINEVTQTSNPYTFSETNELENIQKENKDLENSVSNENLDYNNSEIKNNKDYNLDSKSEKTIDIDYKELLGDLLTDDMSEENLNSPTPLENDNVQKVETNLNSSSTSNENIVEKQNKTVNKTKYSDEISRILQGKTTNNFEHNETKLDFSVKFPDELNEAVKNSKNKTNEPVNEVITEPSASLYGSFDDKKIVIKQYAKWTDKNLKFNKDYININKLRFTKSIIFTILMFFEILGFFLYAYLNDFSFSLEQYIIFGSSVLIVLIYFIIMWTNYRKYPDKKINTNYKWFLNLFYRLLFIIFIAVFIIAIALLLDINTTNLFNIENILRWLFPSVLAINILLGWFVTIILSKLSKFKC